LGLTVALAACTSSHASPGAASTPPASPSQAPHVPAVSWPTRTTTGGTLDRDSNSAVTIAARYVGRVLRAKVFYDGQLPVGRVIVAVVAGAKATRFFAMRLSSPGKPNSQRVDLNLDGRILENLTTIAIQYKTSSGQFLVALTQPSVSALKVVTDDGASDRIQGFDGFFTDNTDRVLTSVTPAVPGDQFNATQVFHVRSP